MFGKVVLRLAVELLPMWPRIERATKQVQEQHAKGNKRKQPGSHTHQEVREGGEHQWEKLRAYWLCGRCLIVAHSAESVAGKAECEGVPKAWKEVMSAQQHTRHKLMIVAGFTQAKGCREWLLCGICGASAQGRRMGELGHKC